MQLSQIVFSILNEVICGIYHKPLPMLHYRIPKHANHYHSTNDEHVAVCLFPYIIYIPSRRA